MRRASRTRLARVAVLAVALASLATGAPAPTTVVSTGADQGLTLSPAVRTLVRHVSTQLKPGDRGDIAQAEVYVDWTAPGPKPIEISVVRDADGSTIELGPLPEVIATGHFGGSFAPFPTCKSGDACVAAFTVSFRLVAADQVATHWTFTVHVDAGSPAAASSTKVDATIAP